MIVIMRDAVMPDCCNTCVCSEGYGCGITGTVMTTKEMEERPDWCPLEEQEPCEDTISRQAAIDAIMCEPTDAHYPSWYAERLEQLPSARPEQRYTKEELRVFQHGISLSLLSKRSAQHWRYDKDTATEIEFLERLYEKVSADMKGGQG